MRYWLMLVLLLAGCTPMGGQFDSSLQPAASVGAFADTPLPLTLPVLAENLATYRGRLLRVSGQFLPLAEAACEPVKGPQPRWALLDADANLRLNVIGYEAITHLLGEGTAVTVDGFLKVYQGPLGCGAKPPMGTIWYLDAMRFVQPNPLEGYGIVAPRPPGGTPPAGMTGTPGIDVTIETTTPAATIEGRLTGTVTVTSSPDPMVTVIGTPTLGPGTPSPTPSPTVAVTGSSTAAPTSGPTPTPSATLPGGVTITPPPATNTPPPYPGQTSTPDPYP